MDFIPRRSGAGRIKTPSDVGLTERPKPPGDAASPAATDLGAVPGRFRNACVRARGIAVVSRTRLFGSLCALVFLVNFARVVFAPLVGEFIDAFGIREGTAGLIVTLAWLGSAAPRLPAGWALTRFTRQRVILVSGAMLTAGALGVALAPSVLALMVAAFAVGLASGVYFVAANPFIAELFPQRVGRVMGVHGMASQLSAVIAAPAVTVALWYDWRYAFYALAVAAAASTLVFAALARRTDLPDAGAGDTDFLGAARGEWKLIFAGIVLMGLTSFVWQGLFNFYVTFLVTERGAAPGVASGALALLFAAGIPGMVLGGRLADRLPTVPFLLGLVFAFALSVATLAVVPGLPALLAVSVVVGLVVHALFPALDTYVLGALPDESRASAYALFSGTALALEAPGSAVVGAAATRLSLGTTFLLLSLALVPVVAALAFAYLLGRFPASRADLA